MLIELRDLHEEFCVFKMEIAKILKEKCKNVI